MGGGGDGVKSAHACVALLAWYVIMFKFLEAKLSLSLSCFLPV